MASDRSFRRGLLAGSVAVVSVLLGALLVSPAQAGWTVGRLASTAGSVSTGALAFSHTGTTTCAAGPAVAATTTCAGTITPASPTTAAGVVTGTDSIADSGTIQTSRLSQQVRAASCAPVKYDDAKGADPLLPRFAVGFQQGDGWGSSSATSLSAGAYAADAVGISSGASLLGSSYTVGVRFKVASGYSGGGGLISLASSPAAVASGTSPGPVAVWMDGAGKVHFRLAGTLGTSATGVSAASYNDGAWHTAVLSVAAVAVSTPTLWVDATSVGAVGLSALTGVAGYWHIGWADLSGISGAPAGTLTGSLSGAFVATSASSSSTVSTLRTAASATAYSAAVLALTGVQHLWMLADTGTTTYAGALPTTMSAPCGQVDVALSFTSPADSIAQQSLAALVAGGVKVVAAPGPGVTQTMTVSLTRDATWNSDVAGLHLYAPLTVTETTTPTSAWTLGFTWPSAAGAFLA